MLARTNASQHPAWNPDEQQLPVVRHSIIGNVLTHQYIARTVDLSLIDHVCTYDMLITKVKITQGSGSRGMVNLKTTASYCFKY